MNISTLTASEEALMKVIWKLETAFMKDILAAYPEPKPHPNTISTYLKILTKKDFLYVKKIGRINQYIINIDYKTYKKKILKEVITNHFEGFGTELVHFLLHEELVKNNDLERIIVNKKNTKGEVNEIEQVSEYLSNLIKKSKKKKNKKKKKKKKK